MLLRRPEPGMNITRNAWKKRLMCVNLIAKQGKCSEHFQADDAVAPQAWSGYTEKRAEEASDVGCSDCLD